MRKSLFYVLAISALFSCTKQEMSEEKQNGADRFVNELTVNMPGPDIPDLKTSFGNETDGFMDLVWNKGDEIAVIENKGSSDEKVSVYVLKGDGGSSSGVFEYAEGDANPQVITDLVYPASAALSGDYDVPEIQNYVSGSFDPSAAVMVWHDGAGVQSAVTFENTVSVVCLQLTGNKTVTSISLKMTSDDAQSAVYELVSSDGVMLDSKVAKSFNIVVPGSESIYDVEFTVTASDGSVLTRNSFSKIFRQSTLVRFPAVDFSGNVYAVGDYWPDDANPEGIVFSVSDGGVHGKVVSLFEKAGQWGPAVSEAGAGVEAMRKEPEDGAAVTSQLISLRKDGADFAVDYPAFDWIYTDLNKGNVDGPWYCPTRPELAEWVAAMSGFDWEELKKIWKQDGTDIPGYSVDKVPMPGYADQAAQDARKAFNAKIKEAGGDEINLYGKYCSTWENSDGKNVFKFYLSINPKDNGGQFRVAEKTDIYNRIRPIRRF